MEPSSKFTHLTPMIRFALALIAIAAALPILFLFVAATGPDASATVILLAVGIGLGLVIICYAVISGRNPLSRIDVAMERFREEYRRKGVGPW